MKLHDDEVDALLAYYDCGLVIQMRLDSAVRALHPKSDGLFALWRAYRSRVAAVCHRLAQCKPAMALIETFQ